jgi:hypothetical protein
LRSTTGARGRPFAGSAHWDGSALLVLRGRFVGGTRAPEAAALAFPYWLGQPT